MEPRNRFQGMNSTSLCSLVGRYDNPRFLAPIDSLKIPALDAAIELSESGIVFFHTNKMELQYSSNFKEEIPYKKLIWDFETKVY
jgi:hypothetical protein